MRDLTFTIGKFFLKGLLEGLAHDGCEQPQLWVELLLNHSGMEITLEQNVGHRMNAFEVLSGKSVTDSIHCTWF